MKTEIKKRAPVARDLVAQKVVYQSDVTPTANGNYITTTNDVKANLAALDTQLASITSTSAVTVEKLQAAESGFAATYVVKQNGSQVGASINIPKDYLVKNAELKTVSTADTPYSGAVVGDKYIDFTVNTTDASETAQHIYLPVKDLVDVYTSGSASGDMVVVAIDANNQITATITNGTVTKAKLHSDVQASLDKADTALQQHQDISGKAEKSEMAIEAVTGDATKKTITLKDGLSQDVVVAHQDISGKADKSEMSVTAGTGDNADKTTIQLKSGTTATVLTTHQDISGKAEKSEMTVTPGTGADSDKTTIQLKSGTTATVLTAHQDVSGKANKVTVGSGQATEGNFFSISATGDLADSGKKASDFKEKQTAYDSDTETASGTAQTVITKVTQNANGEVTVVKANLPAAVQSNWNESDNTSAAYIQNKPPIDGTVGSDNKLATQTTVSTAVSTAIGALDLQTAISNTAGKTVATITESDGVVGATFQDIQITESQVTDLTTDLAAKADKVSGATSGNFAGLDGNGNLTDSGYNSESFAEYEHTHTTEDITDLARVAETGSYNDLDDKPVTTPDNDTLECGAIDATGTEYLRVKDKGIDTAQLEDSAVTTDKLDTSAVTTAKIADANVTTAKIADSNVTTAKIANGAVTENKLAVLNSFQIKDATADTTDPHYNATYTVTIDKGILTITPVVAGA